MAPTAALPPGAVTFAFTDIEGSTTRWERNRIAMQEAVRRHDAILRAAITEHEGHVFKTIGDAFCATFTRPIDAVCAMVAAQRALGAEDFSTVDGLRVRAVVSSGAADPRESDYAGPAVDKVAGLLAIGHGGQVLLTNDTASALDGTLPSDVSLRELGAYRLKDVNEPERVWQLIAPGLPSDFPPLRSLGTLPSNRSLLDSAQFYPVANFTGRDEALAAVHAALRNDGAIAVVHGLSGVGKSSVAREYGWRNRDAYSVVWWLNAQTESGIIDGFLRMGATFVAGLDRLADRHAAAQRVVNSVRSGFDKPVLLVFDNLEDETLMRTWLPRSVRALATSRDAAWSTDINVTALQPWSLETAVAYLLGASARSDFPQADARAIAESLGALPLALAHAAAALRHLRTLSPQRYLERVGAHLKNAPHGAEYPRSVFATFNTAIVQAEQQAPGAAAVLCYAACFAPDAIPAELFQGPIRLCPKGLQPLVPGNGALDLHDAVADDLRLEDALGALDRLSLLAFAQDSATYGVHRLVQRAGRDLFNDARGWTEFAVTAAQEAFPRAEFANWPQCERVLPHAQAALDALPRGAEPPSAISLALRCATYLFARGEYAASELLCTRARSIAEHALGPNHPETARALNNLAVLYMERGRHGEAEPLLKRTLEIRERELGPEHPNVARALHNLGLAYMELGRSAEAEAAHLRAKTIRENAHFEVLFSMIGLGVLYRTQARYVEAESLLARVLAMREQELGPDHPDYGMSLMYLADVYAESGRDSEAERHYVRALAILERALGLFGPDHPDVAECLKGLANVYRHQRRYAEAEALFARALAIREKALGPDHPLTKATREALDALESKT